MNVLSRLRRYYKNQARLGVTRSYGLLEFYLALQRARIARKFLPDSSKNGKVLDIGCGSYPIFLLTSRFVEKYGIDTLDSHGAGISRRIKMINHDIEKGERIPLQNGQVDAVTMLAVLEHVAYDRLPLLLREVFRILKPGGIYIITVPSSCSAMLLRLMAGIGLLSKVEIGDHQMLLRSWRIAEFLREAGFSYVKRGYFEFFLNRWFVAKK